MWGVERGAKPPRVTPKLLSTLPGYTPKGLAADVIAGITVAMVALPLSIAIAIASGTTPDKGIVTAVVGGFLISLLGGSRVQIGGPTGAFIVVVYGVMAHHGFDGLVLATLIAGLMLVAAALLRLGRLIALVPEAVIEGFTIGIALIIAAGELKDALGLATGPLPAALLPKLQILWTARASVRWAALAVTAATVAIILGGRRWNPRLPWPIIAVGAMSAACALFALPVESVASRYGALPSGLPLPAMPSLDAARVVTLLPSAATIAFLAGIESLLSAVVADRMIGGAHRSNAELLAQGVANIGSALFGGLPATGAIARTATNVRAGGRTPVAGIVHALAIMAMMASFAPLAGRLAMPTLAGLLLVTAWTMSAPERWRDHWRAPPGARAALIATLLLTAFADLTVAIIAGTIVAWVAARVTRRRTG